MGKMSELQASIDRLDGSLDVLLCERDTYKARCEAMRAALEKCADTLHLYTDSSQPEISSAIDAARAALRV